MEIKYKALFKFFLGFNILADILAVLQVVLVILGCDTPAGLLWTRFYLTFPIIVLTIWDIKLWSKGEKTPRDILLLIFLPGLYSIFYSIKLLKQP